MKSKKFLHATGIVIGILILIVVILGAYIYSIVPESIGRTPDLQRELFQSQEKKVPVDARFIYQTASDLASMIKSGEATSVEIVQAHINHIKNNNWKYNALVWLNKEKAMEQARMADEAVLAGDTAKPLLGVPVTVKEQFFVKGMPSTLNNSKITVWPQEDAALVKQIRESGAVILGTTNLAFMVMGYQTFGEVYSTASNPYDTTRTPGGSTGGGAAALAAGFTALELGADMGGSIRLPSAFCGLWGLKPGFGSLSLEGVMPLALEELNRFAMASPGPMARSAEDLALFWDVLQKAERDGKYHTDISWTEPSNKTLDQYKIAWEDEWEFEGGKVEVGSDARTKLDLLIDILQNEGVQLTQAIPDIYPGLEEVFFATVAHIIGQNQPRLLRELMLMQFNYLISHKDRAKKIVRKNIRICSQEQWEKIQMQRAELSNRVEQFFSQYDFLITPAAYGPAIKKCERCPEIELSDGTSIPMMDYYSFLFAFNATGHPCLVVPVGLNPGGLPIAVQIIGPYGSEPELLHFARLIEPLVSGFVRPSNM